MRLEETPPNHKKRFVAIFDNGKKVRFGSKHGQTYIDHGDVMKRKAYVDRHMASGLENWGDPYSPGALSRWLLWGPFPTLEANLEHYKTQFEL